MSNTFLKENQLNLTKNYFSPEKNKSIKEKLKTDPNNEYDEDLY
jgi:hypothetical protein